MFIYPIVSINPRELHIKYPYSYGKMYALASRRRKKDLYLVKNFGC